MTKRFDVVVVGNVGIDTNVYLHGAEIDWAVESNFTENLDYVGQAGGYTSRGYAQLGKRTAFIGYVGADVGGALIRDEFARDGIDAEALFIDPAGTSRSINLMYRDGRRKNFYDGKSHLTLQPDLRRCRALLAQTRLAHVHLPHWARHLLPIARELGVTIACDVQDIVSAQDAYRDDFIAYADILFFSAANHADPGPLIAALLQRRPELIVIAGMGAQGCALGTRDGVRYLPPVTLDQPVIDTNGAGDALAVGFLTSFALDRRDLDASLLRGQIAARYTCTQKASSSQLITAAQLDRYAQMHQHDGGA
jgi:sugar/nucleoside kinase (ribokinase family)